MDSKTGITTDQASAITANTAKVGYTDDLVAANSAVAANTAKTGITTDQASLIDAITSTATELNILDGVTSTTAELNLLDGVTATTDELNVLDGALKETNSIWIGSEPSSTTDAAEYNVAVGTTAFLSGRREISVPKKRHTPTKKQLIIEGASGNNLRSVQLNLPVGLLTCVTGVSGSGKSTLINGTLYPLAATVLNGATTLRAAAHEDCSGLDYFDKCIDIDQSPIGRTPRSNPATYTGIFTPVRELFAGTQESRSRGYKLGRFSFNVRGGRCEACQGDGVTKVEMHFLPDIYVPCDVCKGKRYNRETLEIKYKGKNIAEVLDMTVEDALEFFEPVPSIHRKLQTLMDVGLTYVRLGQAATTLSGGEAQRVKLSRELSKRDTGSTLYILDEPTTGLHFEDIRQLLDVLHRLRDGGNTVVIIEHNLDVIKTADWVVDLGPEGGSGGGQIIATGTPEEVAKNKKSHTGKFLAPLLK